MSSTQFDEAMKGKLLERAETVWRGAQAKREATRSRWWVMALAGLAVVLCVARWVAGPAQASEGSSVPFGRGTVVSAAIVGAGAGVEDVLPPEEKGSVESAEAHAAAAEAETGKVPLPGASPSGAQRCASCEAAARAAKERARAPARMAVPPPAATPADEVAPDEEPASGPESVLKGLSSLVPGEAKAAVVNVGSQFPVVLDLPVTTGGAGGPVSGHVADDVQVAGKVVIPAGSRVAGEAFATESDDRAQVLVTSVIVGGKTVACRGLALGPDGAFGVPGKVLRKGSRGKSMLGKALSGAGSALSFGLLGNGGGLAGAAEYGLTSAAGRELSGLEQTWRVSNKIVRVPEGTRVMVYLRADLSL